MRLYADFWRSWRFRFALWVNYCWKELWGFMEIFLWLSSSSSCFLSYDFLASFPYGLLPLSTTVRKLLLVCNMCMRVSSEHALRSLRALCSLQSVSLLYTAMFSPRSLDQRKELNWLVSLSACFLHLWPQALCELYAPSWKWLKNWPVQLSSKSALPFTFPTFKHYYLIPSSLPPELVQHVVSTYNKIVQDSISFYIIRVVEKSEKVT